MAAEWLGPSLKPEVALMPETVRQMLPSYLGKHQLPPLHLLFVLLPKFKQEEAERNYGGQSDGETL